MSNQQIITTRSRLKGVAVKYQSVVEHGILKFLIITLLQIYCQMCSEITLKTGQYLTKLWQKLGGLVFGPPCISRRLNIDMYTYVTCDVNYAAVLHNYIRCTLFTLLYTVYGIASEEWSVTVIRSVTSSMTSRRWSSRRHAHLHT